MTINSLLENSLIDKKIKFKEENLIEVDQGVMIEEEEIIIKEEAQLNTTNEEAMIGKENKALDISELTELTELTEQKIEKVVKKGGEKLSVHREGENNQNRIVKGGDSHQNRQVGNQARQH